MKHRKGKRPEGPKKTAKRIDADEARARKLDAKALAFLRLERAMAERVAVIEARERAAEARDAALSERDGLANERDRLAVERDRAAAERDAAANEREQRAAEREAALDNRIAASAGTPPAATGDETDEQALERARLEAQLQRAHLDGLTGAYRREVGRLALRNEIERARRSDGRFVIAFVDVDGLKGVNDREGHAAGDRVLRTLAATMRANLRSYDPIVRYGGDEFVCGVAQIDTVEVQHRLGVIDQSLRHATGVGITAGLAAMTGNESLEELTERADAALLEAKRGRPN
ncbi:MAG TPA: GGDEF domain-containing protein [Candidatus Limnocylindrales bacterium]